MRGKHGIVRSFLPAPGKLINNKLKFVPMMGVSDKTEMDRDPPTQLINIIFNINQI